ncbi:MAG: TlpA family protein disulfide reductase [Chloroflexi bacterium]|nr:TlpA family protein disulfide reductase [Chloroflexota bacterium]
MAGEQAVRSRMGPWGITVLGLVTAGVLALLGLLAFGMARQGTGRTQVAINTVGQAAAVQPRPAADFQLGLFSGELLRLSDLRGKTIVLNFWASWCPPCRAEAPELQKVHQTYQGREVVVLGIDLWDSEQSAQAFIRDFGLTYPNGPNLKGDIAIEYGVMGIPETFIINTEGQLVRRWIGPLTAAQLTALIEEVR